MTVLLFEEKKNRKKKLFSFPSIPEQTNSIIILKITMTNSTVVNNTK